MFIFIYCALLLYSIVFFKKIFYVLIRVLKPGPAQRVDPGPGRPGPGIGPGGGKNQLGNWSGETQSTRDPVHLVNPGETSQIFFYIDSH